MEFMSAMMLCTNITAKVITITSGMVFPALRRKKVVGANGEADRDMLNNVFYENSYSGSALCT
jgi:hypothetical protein